MQKQRKYSVKCLTLAIREGFQAMRRTILRAHRLIPRSAAFLLVTLCLTGVALAQSTNSGDIRGTVTDPSGAVVPGVKVTVLNVDTGVSNEYTTNGAGLYDTVSILPGNYSVTFIKAGFEELLVGGVVLEVGAPQTVNGRLAVGTSATTISVTAETPLLKTETGDQSTSLAEHAITELPLVNRDWSQLTGMLPGAVGTGTGVSVNGVMPYEANWLSDGGTAINPHSANVNTAMFETVAEIQIETSNYSAQYGTGSVVFNQISKGGTNQWHGSLYEYLENDFLNARSYFSPKVNNLRYDNYGGAVGGPIIRNKAFFFFNDDRIHDTSTSYGFNTVPTPAMEAGIFDPAEFGTIYEPNTYNSVTGTRTPFPGNQIPGSGYTMDPVALAVQKYWPATSGPNASAYVNNNQTATTSAQPWTRYFGRADIQLTGSNRLTMSVTQQDNPNTGPSYDGVIDSYVGDSNSYNAQVSDVWTLSPALVNEARLSYHREDDHYSQDDLGLGYPQKIGWTYAEANMFPCVSVGGTVAGYGIGCTDQNAHYAQNTFSAGDTFTWIHGKHVLHFGGEVLKFMDNDTKWGNIQPGSLNFSGTYTSADPNAATVVGFADFLLGDVQSYSSTNSPINAMRETQPQVFAQDDWKIRPNLTINLGLRYQVMTGWHETHNQLGDFDPAIINPATNTLGAMWFSPNDKRNQLMANVYDIVLPRVGFAWSAANKLVLRGGFGMFIQPWSEDEYSADVEGLGAATLCGITDNTKLTPVFQFSAASPNLNCSAASKAASAYNGQGVDYYPYNSSVAKIYQWSFSVERELSPGLVAEAAYVANHGTHLPYAGVDINQVPASLLAQSYANPTTQQSLRPYPQFQNIGGGNEADLDTALSNYDALQLSLKKRLAHGLMFETNYTWSKMLSDQDSSGWSGNGGSAPYQNANSPASNYGLSNLNRAQLFKADSIYELPFGKGRTFLNHAGPLDYIAGGWQASGTFAFQSGQPYTPTMGGNNNSGAMSGNWFPDVVGNPKLSHPTIQEWFNTAAFAVPAGGHWGNAARNLLIGPRFSALNFSMAKGFAIPGLESGRFQIRIDANNILNHTSFSNPNATIQPNPANIVSSGEGQITGTTNSGRLIQLGGRFSF